MHVKRAHARSDTRLDGANTELDRSLLVHKVVAQSTPSSAQRLARPRATLQQRRLGISYTQASHIHAPLGAHANIVEQYALRLLPRKHAAVVVACPLVIIAHTHCPRPRAKHGAKLRGSGHTQFSMYKRAGRTTDCSAGRANSVQKHRVKCAPRSSTYAPFWWSMASFMTS